jgi:hypothetical protein
MFVHMADVTEMNKPERLRDKALAATNTTEAETGLITLTFPGMSRLGDYDHSGRAGGKDTENPSQITTGRHRWLRRS